MLPARSKDDAAKPAVGQIEMDLFAQPPLGPDAHRVRERQTGGFLAANEAVVRSNALQTAGELIGKTDFDLFPAAVAQGFFDTKQAIMAGGEPMIDNEAEWMNRSGASKWVQTTKVPIREALVRG